MIGGEHSKQLELFGRQRSAPCQCNVVNACRNAGLQAITKTYKNRTYFCLGHNMSITQKNVFIVLNASGFVALWCFDHTFVSLPSLGKTEWRTQPQPWKNCKTIAQCASKLRLMMYNVGLGLIIIAAIRASKRAETKVISDLAAWSES